MDAKKVLEYYIRSDIKKALIHYSKNREVSVMFGLERFGRRPDVLIYENDVEELARQGATSFHCSEEIWDNPMSIVTGMKKNELDGLRSGWDIILDIDCPNWRLSKLTAHLFIKALQDHGVESISCKFSGNKGFHIGVPFAAFPDKFHHDEEMRNFKDLFPDGARKIALYLLTYITKKYAKVVSDGVLFLDEHKFSFDELKIVADKTAQDLFMFVCPDCKKVFENNPVTNKVKYECSKCGHRSYPKGNPDVVRCEACSFPVEAMIEPYRCSGCSSYKIPAKDFNFFAVVDVDTVLIASRHLYRMPYSLHEKSGLASIPVPLDSVLQFEKEMAKPTQIVFDDSFLVYNNTKKSETSQLIRDSFDFAFSVEKNKAKKKKEVIIPLDAISEEFFPPCINNILKGMEDGKKRGVFILMSFLRSIGWDFDQVEAFVYEWNDKNPEPLKEQYINGQLQHMRKSSEVVAPPSCSNSDYYKSLMICTPNRFCPKINNPASYTKRKSELEKLKEANKSNSSKKKKEVVKERK